MSTETDLFTVLGPLVANRVYPLNFIQPNGKLPVWPAIRYSIVSEVPNATMCGDSGDTASDVRVQIDVVDSGYKTMRALRSQVMWAMKEYIPLANLEGSSDEYDDLTKTYRALLDYVIFRSTPAGSPFP